MTSRQQTKSPSNHTVNLKQIGAFISKHSKDSVFKTIALGHVKQASDQFGQDAVLHADDKDFRKRQALERIDNAVTKLKSKPSLASHFEVEKLEQQVATALHHVLDIQDEQKASHNELKTKHSETEIGTAKALRHVMDVQKKQAQQHNEMKLQQSKESAAPKKSAASVQQPTEKSAEQPAKPAKPTSSKKSKAKQGKKAAMVESIDATLQMMDTPDASNLDLGSVVKGIKKGKKTLEEAAKHGIETAEEVVKGAAETVKKGMEKTLGSSSHHAQMLAHMEEFDVLRETVNADPEARATMRKLHGRMRAARDTKSRIERNTSPVTTSEVATSASVAEDVVTQGREVMQDYVRRQQDTHASSQKENQRRMEFCDSTLKEAGCLDAGEEATF